MYPVVGLVWRGTLNPNLQYRFLFFLFSFYVRGALVKGNEKAGGKKILKVPVPTSRVWSKGYSKFEEVSKYLLPEIYYIFL